MKLPFPIILIVLLMSLSFFMLPAYADDVNSNVDLNTAVPAYVTLTCAPNPIVFSITPGSPPTSSTETITCTVLSNDEDSTVPVIFTGNIDGSNHVVITHTNSVDTLNVLVDNPGGAAVGAIPNLDVTIVAGVDTDFTFDSTIDNLASTTLAGFYSSLSPLTLTATGL